MLGRGRRRSSVQPLLVRQSSSSPVGVQWPIAKPHTCLLHLRTLTAALLCCVLVYLVLVTYSSREVPLTSMLSSWVSEQSTGPIFPPDWDAIVTTARERAPPPPDAASLHTHWALVVAGDVADACEQHEAEIQNSLEILFEDTREWMLLLLVANPGECSQTCTPDMRCATFVAEEGVPGNEAFLFAVEHGGEVIMQLSSAALLVLSDSLTRVPSSFPMYEPQHSLPHQEHCVNALSVLQECPAWPLGMPLEDVDHAAPEHFVTVTSRTSPIAVQQLLTSIEIDPVFELGGARSCDEFSSAEALTTTPGTFQSPATHLTIFHAPYDWTAFLPFLSPTSSSTTRSLHRAYLSQRLLWESDATVVSSVQSSAATHSASHSTRTIAEVHAAASQLKDTLSRWQFTPVHGRSNVLDAYVELGNELMLNDVWTLADVHLLVDFLSRLLVLSVRRGVPLAMELDGQWRDRRAALLHHHADRAPSSFPPSPSIPLTTIGSPVSPGVPSDSLAPSECLEKGGLYYILAVDDVRCYDVKGNQRHFTKMQDCEWAVEHDADFPCMVFPEGDPRRHRGQHEKQHESEADSREDFHPFAEVLHGTLPPVQWKSLDKPLLFVVDAQHGLGNRLRAIASGACFAENTNRRLVVVWKRDNHLDASFEDLFDVTRITVLDYLDLQTVGVGPSDVMAEEHRDAVQYWDAFNYMEYEEGSEPGRWIEDSDRNIFFRSAFLANSSYNNFLEMSQFFHRRLTPAQEVREAVETITTNAEFASHKVYGVHIRARHTYEDSVADLGTAHRTQYEEHMKEFDSWRDKTGVQAFLGVMDAISKEEPDARFYVATDKSEIYDIIEQRYGKERIVTQSRHGGYRHQVHAMREALVDLMVLSRCDELLGSFWSSFTEVAYYMGLHHHPHLSLRMAGRDFSA